MRKQQKGKGKSKPSGTDAASSTEPASASRPGHVWNTNQRDVLREAPCTPPVDSDDDYEWGHNPEWDESDSDDDWGNWERQGYDGDDWIDEHGNLRNAAEEHTAFRREDSGSTQD